MTTKFNQSMYARMRAKKNEPPLFFLRFDSFSLGTGGEPPPYFGVSYLGGQG